MREVINYKYSKGIPKRECANKAGIDVMTFIENNCAGHTTVKITIEIGGKVK